MLFPAEHPHSKKLHTFSFLTMLAVSTQVVETNPNSAPEVVYIIHWKMFWLQTVVSCTWCKRYLFLLKYCLETWFTFMYMCDIWWCAIPGSCDSTSLTGGQNNFSYCQWFQWSSWSHFNWSAVHTRQCHKSLHFMFILFHVKLCTYCMWMFTKQIILSSAL